MSHKASNPFAALPEPLRVKLHACREQLRGLERVVVAFSGGVDSTFLLALAIDALGRENVLAVTGVSPSLPASEREACGQLARQLDAAHEEIETCEMENDSFSANPPERCFFCKSDLFTRLRTIADERGCRAVLTGANADDTGDFRPGIKAGEKLGAVSPLMAAGMTKQDIRDASRAMGLATWNKPAMACLASRIPYGENITPEKLARIEQAEALLHSLGFGQCRVRTHDRIARIEVPAEELPRAIGLRDRIVPELTRMGYAYVTLDMAGFRSGSMNEVLPGRRDA